jgi:AraC-like DNA-binding protein
MNARIARIVCYINAHYRDPVTLTSVAALFEIHPDYLSRCFKVEVGVRFHQYLLWKRLEYAKGLLTSSPGSSIKQVGYDAGFSCPETFSKTFRRTVGCSPRAYRNRSGMVSLRPRRPTGPRPAKLVAKSDRRGAAGAQRAELHPEASDRRSAGGTRRSRESPVARDRRRVLSG